MVQHNGNRFTNSRVPIDNQRFENCTFDKCTLIYSASGPVQFVGCTFSDSPISFDGAAAATLKFMTELYKVTPLTIEGTFDKIRLGM
jgi:hypothetical protein